MGDSLGRRELFQVGAIVAAAALPGCGSRKDERPTGAGRAQPTATATATAVTPAPIPAADVAEVSIAELQARMTSGAETSASLVDKYRQRIDATNLRGPMLRAVLEVNPEADAIARDLDLERAAGKVRGPLHGIPILLKDNIDTGDRMTTTAGSLALAGTRATHDAPAIARLRAAGAILLGKANLSEWANFRGNASSSGWSGRGGQCRNPYALDRSPSGSSSGSAVAAAASLCAAALGSETDGSIVSPASCNGLVGIKPTIGLVSRTGVIPISSSQDTLGPLARTVADAAALLTVLAGADPADPTTTAAHPRRPTAAIDYAAHLDPKALVGARLGVPRKGFFGSNRNVDGVMTAMLARLTELGAVLVDPAELEAPAELGGAEFTVLQYELKATMAAYLATRPAGVAVRTLADLIAFNVAHADRELTYFGQELFEASAAKGALTDRAYLDARARCVAIARAQMLDQVMASAKLDAFVAITSGPAWMIDQVDGDPHVGVGCSQLPAVAGYPHVTVPGAPLLGLPVGLSFFGAAYSEAKLIGYAYAWEQATHHRAPPRYLPTATLT